MGFEKGTATPLACPSLVTNSLGWVGQGSPTATEGNPSRTNDPT